MHILFTRTVYQQAQMYMQIYLNEECRAVPVEEKARLKTSVHRNN